MGSVPSVPTFAAGEILTSTKLGQLRDAVAFLREPPQCVLRYNGATAIGTSSSTAKLSFDTVSRDTDGMFAAGGITVQTSGLYLLSLQIGWSANSTGVREVAIYANNTLAADSKVNAVGGGLGTYQSISVPLYCVAGAVVEARIGQNTGADLALASTSWIPSLSAAWIGY